MGEKSLYEIANENVQAHYPEPTADPMMAGITGAVAAGAAIALFLAVAGLPSEAFGPAIGITIGAGFFGPFLYHRAMHNRYSALVAEELYRLQQMAARD